MIEIEHPSLSVVRQCELVSISRSGFYYQPVGETDADYETGYGAFLGYDPGRGADVL